jgi:type VI secretion system secreted protein VgrG
MAESYQDKRSVKVSSPFGANALLFVRMAAIEHVSRPFQLEVTLYSESSDLDADKILGKALVVTLDTGKHQRHFHGLVSEFAQTGFSERFHEYRAVVRPWLWFLTRTADCRIFQAKSVPEIFRTVCQQAGFSDFEVKLGSYPPREYCVQYRETDFNFLSRLLEQEGIFYYFEHGAAKHTLVLTDDVSKCSPIEGYDSVPFYAATADAALRERDHLQTWAIQKTFQSGSYATRDYNLQQPSPILAGTSSISRKHEASRYEVFDYPADAAQLTSAGVEQVAKVRVQELQAAQMLARGSGDAAGLCAGRTFKLIKHPNSASNIEYLLTATTIELSSDSYYAGGGSAGTTFSISVEAVDVREAYRPMRMTPKPLIQGTQTALVVGPGGDEIHTDDLGRIKVQFHWDRYGELNEKSSCFVRVGQIWAGKSWGGIHIPRIGQEVIVSFIEGDPDRPLVIGSVYNGSNKPPFALPDNKTQSGVRSRSSKGGTADNCNELRFEDLKGSELVYLHAEKDQTIEVENDESHSVGHDRTKSVTNDERTTIGKNRTESVGANESITISKDRTESVGGGETIGVSKDRALTIGGNSTVSVGKDESIAVSGNRTDEVEKDEQVSIGKNRTHNVGEDDSLSVGKTLVIDVGDEITLKTGSASIVMKKDGTILIKGKDITLDGDGKINVSAGSDLVMKGSKITQN